MRLGLALPQFDYSVEGERPLRWDSVVRYARAAEASGFDSIWLADHLFLSLERWGGPDELHGCVDPLVAIPALARLTTRVRLGTLVLCAPLRPPAIAAKALATADVLSGGRVVAGLGAGWYEREFVEAGVPFLPPGQRLAQLREAIAILRGMFAGGAFDFDGVHFRASGAQCDPRPVQPEGPPIWVGGRGDKLLDLVAAHADGWNTVWSWTTDRYRERLEALDRACTRAGRDRSAVTLSLGLTTLVGEDESDVQRRFDRMASGPLGGAVGGADLRTWRAGKLVGTPEQVRDQVGEWEALGVSTVIVGLGAVPFAVTDTDDVELVASAFR